MLIALLVLLGRRCCREIVMLMVIVSIIAAALERKDSAFICPIGLKMDCSTLGTLQMAAVQRVEGWVKAICLLIQKSHQCGIQDCKCWLKVKCASTA